MTNLYDMEYDAYQLIKQTAGKFLRPDSRLLEVGVGSGELLRELTKIYHTHSIGIDPYIREYEDTGISFRAKSAENLVSLKEKFDFIYSVLSFHHFTDPVAFLQGLETALSWNGKFLIVDWKNGTNTGVPESYYELADLLRMLKRTNLNVLEQKTTPFHFLLFGESKKKKVAVATDDGETIFPKMFGQAAYFHIYTVGENGVYSFEEQRENRYQTTLQHLKTLDVYDEVSDCQGLLSAHIGKRGRERLSELGVKLFFAKGKIAAALDQIVAEAPGKKQTRGKAQNGKDRTF